MNSCPYRCETKVDGTAGCQLQEGRLNDRQQEYCLSDYENCPLIKERGILTEAICEEIYRKFAELVKTLDETKRGVGEIASYITQKSDYMPLYDAGRTLREGPEVPSAEGIYSSMVTTDQEKDLAYKLEKQLNELLDDLASGMNIGDGNGAYITAEPKELYDSAARMQEAVIGVGYCGGDSFYVSVDPDRFAEPIRDLGCETVDKVREYLKEAADAYDEAAENLDHGIQRTLEAANTFVGPILSDPNLPWPVEAR